MKNYKLINADCIEAMKQMQENSIDSIVTDPPYELGFMGKSWDASGIAYNVEMWSEALRILKPGGHLLAFGGSRTYHRLAVAIEDAGFQIRDSIAWIYGSGFPKSLDVSKAIDKAAGAEREVVKTGFAYGISVGQEAQGYRPADYVSKQVTNKPITPEAQQWQGWGTALKPAIEPIVVARKPLIGTVAENVLTWGVGGLNIDGSRVGTGSGESKTVSYPDIRGDNYKQGKEAYAERGTVERLVKDQGRWPANIILDEVTAQLLDEQSGTSTSKANTMKIPDIRGGKYGSEYGTRDFDSVRGHNDSGGASRFFYVAKASKRDRNEGLEDLDDVTHRRYGDRNAGSLPNQTAQGEVTGKNFHPTVKPTQLMRYLVRLVTPPDGTVLDPFMGSGSTGKAAMLESFNFIGIEQSAEYITICEKRIEHAKQQIETEPTQQNLF